MRKIHIGFILSFIILFSYQNCSIPKAKSSLEENQGQSGSLTGGLANEDITSVTFLSNENVQVQQNAKTFTLISQNSYSINYQTAVITKSTQVSGSQEYYCLPQALMNELRDIVESSSVCLTENKPPEGQLCTQVYTSGYAQIATGSEIFDLGSSSDGCGSRKVDLCQKPNIDMLKGWFVAVKNQLPQLNCPQ